VNLTEKDLDELIARAEAQVELDAVIGTECLADRINNRRSIPRVHLPWGRIRDKFDLRPGEVTIWAGDNGSGKSMLVGQVMVYLLTANQRVLIASMEMKPEETVERMIIQAAGQVPPADFVSAFCSWAEGRLWLYDQLDTVASDRVLNMVRAVVQELGVQHVVIDSLVKCGVKQDGDGALTAQTVFVDKLQHLAKHLDVHIHLIAHTRKPERDSTRITKHDIRGASQITDLADNVVLLMRNRRKERELQLPPDDRDEDVLAEPDSTLTVAKQRHYSWEGSMGLDYLPECMQFVRHNSRNEGPMPWPADNIPPWRKQ
jgi:twinkle protein